MYSQITANKRRTWLLMTLFTVVILALGYVYDLSLGQGAGAGGLVFAVIISLALTLFSYLAGDRLAIWTAGAKPIEKRDAPELYRIVENLSITAGIPTPKIHLIPDPAVNAFATGRDPQHASIAVTTGAMERLANEELEGVIAHELSHIKNFDIRLMMVIIVLVGTIALLSDWLLRARWYGFGRRNDDRAGGQIGAILMLVGIILAIFAPLIAELIKLAVSRRREFLADASGALLTRYPEGLARALEKIAASSQPMLRANTATAHLFIASPFGGRKKISNLFSTHPPIEERVRILRSMAI